MGGVSPSGLLGVGGIDCSRCFSFVARCALPSASHGSPAVASHRSGIGTVLVFQPAGCRGFTGPVPPPLWMSAIKWPKCGSPPFDGQDNGGLGGWGGPDAQKPNVGWAASLTSAHTYRALGGGAPPATELEATEGAGTCSAEGSQPQSRPGGRLRCIFLWTWTGSSPNRCAQRSDRRPLRIGISRMAVRPATQPRPAPSASRGWIAHPWRTFWSREDRPVSRRTHRRSPTPGAMSPSCHR